MMVEGATEPDGWVRAFYGDGRPTRRRPGGFETKEYEAE